MDWISNITENIERVISTSRTPAQTVPVMPLYCESELRSGLSATLIASKIISRLPDVGVPTGNNPDGSENVVNKVIKILCEEVVNAIKEDGVVMISVPPMKISVTASGGNAGGPVVVTGYNSSPTLIKGVMQ